MLKIWDFIFKVNGKLLKYLICWNAMIRNAFFNIYFFFFLLLKTEFKREARMLCGEMHLAAITKAQKRDNSSVNLSGSCSGNGKKVGASALE